MSKQVYEYGISAVHYSEDHKHIESVRVHEITVGEPAIWPLSRVTKEMSNDAKFVTIIELEGGHLEPSANVAPYKQTFIRSNPHDGVKDNLASLPEFDIVVPSAAG
jgi:uncharacterized protein DUF3892